MVGETKDAAIRKLGVTPNTYYRWRKEYGGMRVDQAKRLKELETENSRLKHLVAGLTLMADTKLQPARAGRLLAGQAQPERSRRIERSRGGSGGLHVRMDRLGFEACNLLSIRRRKNVFYGLHERFRYLGQFPFL
ncbi:MAG: transposase [Armatimonadota bacterium]|nr:transposase [Armatimonadota bacterium]